MTRATDFNLNAGLVLSIPMFEGTGSSFVADTSYVHHQIAMTHSPGWVQTASGLWVLDFDGASDELSIASSDALNFTSQSFTVALWLYPHVLTGATKVFIEKGTYGTNGWWVGHDMSFRFIAYLDSGTHYTQIPDDVLVIDTWQLMAVTFTTSICLGYRNAIDMTSRDDGDGNIKTAAGVAAKIGRSSAGTEQYNGLMWNPRVWNRALSPVEHMQIFNRERALFGV